MLTNMKEEMKTKVIPQFNINNLEWTRFILEECQEQNYPVILGVSEGAIKYMGGYDVVTNMVKALIKDLKIEIPVSIHLDHGSSIESCIEAINAGFTSVMLDLSNKPLQENIDTIKALVKKSHPYISVEAEVGPIGIEKTNENYTSIENCKKMKETKIDMLAPAIGNQHGIYKGQVNLDYELLEQIYEETNMPLVLHGASGLSEQQLKECIKRGIKKINFNTELQIAWANETRKYIEKNENVYDPRKIIKSGEKALKNIVKEKIEIIKQV